MNELQLNLWLRLAFSYGVGSATMLKLLRRFGTVANIYAQEPSSLAQLIGKGVTESIFSTKSQPLVNEALTWLQQESKKRCILTLESELYPAELAEIANPPLVLFAEGNINLLTNQKIAIVGTRHPTVQGIENARIFAKELAYNGLTIVSGLAAGIDRFAHEGALGEEASTIAVLGTGIDLVYPASNRYLFKKITEAGLILSEYPLGTNAVSSNFPRRNRIVVGLSQACLVIESAADGGSMISANFALEMGREIMAIPGSIHNPMARGCHKLIKQGAKLVEIASDVLEELRLVIGSGQRHNSISHVDNSLLQAMGFDPITIDSLSAKLNYDFAELCGMLLELELVGAIVNCGNGRYQRIFK